MGDKKNDDFVVRMPSSANVSAGEKDRFIPKRRGSSIAGGVGAGAGSFFSSLEHNGTFAVAAYCVASISMTLVNKFVVSGHSWNLHILYLAIQHIICSAAIVFGKQVGLIKDMEGFDVQKAKKCFPLAILLVLMIFTGNKALQFLSVPVYTILKNLTVIVIAYGEVIWFGGSVSALAFMSFALMIFSSVVAAWSDFRNAATAVGAAGVGIKDAASSSTSVSTLNAGYFWMLLNVFIAAMYALSMRKSMKSLQLKNWDVIYYNNVLTIPVLLGASLIFEDWSSVNLQSNFPTDARRGLIIGMIYSGLGAIFISYCTAWCIRATSSTTYAMAGALNKLPLAVLGIIFFADPVTFGGVCAIFLGFVSGLIYNLARTSKPSQASAPSLPLTNQQAGHRGSS